MRRTLPLTIAAGERYLRTERQPAAPMRPLYDARIEDLGPGDFLRVECAACGHEEMIPRAGLVIGLRLPASMRVLALEPRFRCRQCDQRGKVMLSIKWAAG